MKNLFFGGIHPKYNKEMSTKETSFRTISPKQVVIPMRSISKSLYSAGQSRRPCIMGTENR